MGDHSRFSLCLCSLMAPRPLAVLPPAMVSWHEVSSSSTTSRAKGLLPHSPLLAQLPSGTKSSCKPSTELTGLKMTHKNHPSRSSVDSFTMFTVLWEQPCPCTSSGNLLEWSDRKREGSGEKEGRPSTPQHHQHLCYCYQRPCLTKLQLQGATFNSPPPSFEKKFSMKLSLLVQHTQIWGWIYQFKLLEPSWTELCSTCIPLGCCQET